AAHVHAPAPARQRRHAAPLRDLSGVPSAPARALDAGRGRAGARARDRARRAAPRPPAPALSRQSLGLARLRVGDALAAARAQLRRAARLRRAAPPVLAGAGAMSDARVHLQYQDLATQPHAARLGTGPGPVSRALLV